MTEKEKLDFYKELYFREFDDRNNLNDAISLPISIISALLAGVFYLVTSFDFSKDLSADNIFFLIPLTICVLLTYGSIYYLILSYTSFRGKYDFIGLPYAEELNKYNIKLTTQSMKKNNSSEEGEKAFEEYLLKKYVEYADRNTRVNDKRRGLFLRSKRMLIFGIIAISVSFIPFIKKHLEKDENIQKIDIVKYPDQLKLP